MSVTDFDWSTFIAEITEVPIDVVFQVVEDGEIHEIKVHKVVVGMVSKLCGHTAIRELVDFFDL